MSIKQSSNFFSTISSLWNSTETPSQLLMNKEILEVAHSLHGILYEVTQNVSNKKEKNTLSNTLALPRLVVVGTQSSGKSTLLNRLICMDLLPTGNEMVTRAPLHMYLKNSAKNPAYIDFGSFHNGKWKSIKKINITMPIPTNEEVGEVRNTIVEITNHKAGQSKNISYSPIYMNIQTPYIPELQLVDLPGLTMVACRDKGQPKDIKEQIKRLVSSYIKQDQTVILSVMAARTDLETDLALDLIKEIDPLGKRTLGILTKVDLMNVNTDISSYLSNTISKDLQLFYGYYALKNRSSKERETQTILEGIQLEKSFFQNHPVYKKNEFTKNLGVISLGSALSSILQSKMRQSIPVFRALLNNKLEIVKKDLDSIGETIPEEVEGLKLLLHKTIIDIGAIFKNSVLGYSTNLPYGREIKEVLVSCRKNIERIDPFTENTDFSKEYLRNYILNSQGNHMSISYTPIHLLEHCFSQSETHPFRYLCEPTKKCCSEVKQILRTILENILEENKYKRYPNLCTTIKNIFLDKRLEELEQYTLKKIDEFLSIEETYIWTCDEDFYNKLSSIHQNSSSRSMDYKKIITVLSAYFTSIKTIAKHSIPKLVMFHFINKSIKELSLHLFTQSSNYVSVSVPSSNTFNNTDEFYRQLFDEPTEIASKRKQFNYLYSRLIEANKLLSTLSI